ncbi:ATPase family AAA domain-containing protein 1-A [Lophiostoma macrostomum CBS 122681]|uniref:ATPase family AAA domain-containing protein 1-A n=1 Tax=Lophiostoma macrostomum CBS 122681 TaxID=1314788 RepID=A0A6A6T453_9PLEO|nr:ATPase family AAA domain-containing protein 1-A [Lophiostoma macrostomum CBS 122681]
MYAAFRPALRSASQARPPARLIHGRRYPLSSRIRAFHTSCCLARDGNPSPSPNNTPETEKNADEVAKEKTEVAAAEEQTDNGSVLEDPEVIARKLQRSKEMTRRYTSALRRSQRRNRAQDLPPIIVPTWFLSSRVRLREDIPPRSRFAQHNQCALSLQHTQLGENGTCLIPITSYPTTAKSLSLMTKALWKQGLSEDLRKQLARDFTKRLGREDEKERLEQSQQTQESSVRAVSGNAEGDNAEQAPSEGKEADLLAKERQKENNVTDTKRISALSFAEVRATVIASLSALHPSINESFPSTKSNLILHSPANDSEPLLNNLVQTVAAELGADVVILQAQDLAQLAGDYIGEGSEPSPNSIRSLGYETYNHGLNLAPEIDELGRDEQHDDEQGVTGDQSTAASSFFQLPFIALPFTTLSRKAAGKAGMSHGSKSNQTEASRTSTQAQASSTQAQSEIQLEDLKLSTLLEALVDSTELKRGMGPSDIQSKVQSVSPSTSRKQTENTEKTGTFTFDYSFTSGGAEYDFSAALPPKAKDRFKLTINNGPPARQPDLPPKPKIVFIKDIKELNATQHGSRIMQKLEDIVRRQRAAGQSIMLLGTTCSLDLTPKLSPSAVQDLQSEGQDSSFRTIVVIPGNVRKDDWVDIPAAARERLREANSSKPEQSKFFSINVRHIQDMLRCLDPVASSDLTNMDRGGVSVRLFASIFPQSCFWSVMTWDEVHRIALTALGLHLLDPVESQLSWAHVALAMGLLKASDEVKHVCIKHLASEQKASSQSIGKEGLPVGHKSRDSSAPEVDKAILKRSLQLKHVKATASQHEKRLLHGIVDPQHIKTTFDNVHVPKDTIDAIRTLTSLSLLRPDAFDYGVLSMEKISGALLYGPPGTGKTMLAKAVAKESACAVLEVSGSEIMDKYVGEGEKNVAAIFSLAQKLSPCIVFLDEADAIFGTRDAGRERTAHRDILNQFLKEWDGLNNVSVFVMVATNRPFDMDDAVIRRLPRRLLVDLPTEDDRKKILEIHLRGEQLDPSVDLDDLAKRTPLYSGSDLKNVAVFAALACVKEENEQAAIAAVKAATEKAQSESQEVSTTSTAPEPQLKPSETPVLVQGKKYEFPERRTLHLRHFDKALQEVSASISENMASLNAIKKFDEQYGDRKGRRKKTVYGFGTEAEVNGNAARVRT